MCGGLVINHFDKVSWEMAQSKISLVFFRKISTHHFHALYFLLNVKFSCFSFDYFLITSHTTFGQRQSMNYFFFNWYSVPRKLNTMHKCLTLKSTCTFFSHYKSNIISNQKSSWVLKEKKRSILYLQVEKQLNDTCYLGFTNRFIKDEV